MWVLDVNWLYYQVVLIVLAIICFSIGIRTWIKSQSKKTSKTLLIYNYTFSRMNDTDSNGNIIPNMGNNANANQVIYVKATFKKTNKKSGRKTQQKKKARSIFKFRSSKKNLIKNALKKGLELLDQLPLEIVVPMIDNATNRCNIEKFLRKGNSKGSRKYVLKQIVVKRSRRAA